MKRGKMLEDVCVKIFHYDAHGRLVIALMMIIAVVMARNTVCYDDDSSAAAF